MQQLSTVHGDILPLFFRTCLPYKPNIVSQWNTCSGWHLPVTYWCRVDTYQRVYPIPLLHFTIPCMHACSRQTYKRLCEKQTYCPRFSIFWHAQTICLCLSTKRDERISASPGGPRPREALLLEGVSEERWQMDC